MKWNPIRRVADCGLWIADRSGILARMHNHSNAVVLMYHSIVPKKPSAIGVPAVDGEDFVRQLHYLKQHFQILDPKDLNERFPSIEGNGKPSLVLTFDDGLGSNAKIVAPILEEMRIPAIFFVSARHLQPGRYLWFMHARALFWLWPERRFRLLGRIWEQGSSSTREQVFQDFLNQTSRVSAEQMYDDLAQYPVDRFVPPEIIENEMRGMTENELAAVAQSRLISIGNHTCNHPYLTTCTQEQVEEEIAGANAQLERICGRRVTSFAYPAGDYDAAIASQVSQAGFKLAFAVRPRVVIGDTRMAIPRAGIYHASRGILAGKSYGLITR